MIAGKGWLMEHRIFAVGALGGRFDQTMSSVSAAHEFGDAHVVLIGRHSMAFVVPARTRVAIVPDTAHEGPTCGLIPVCGVAKNVRTSGLRWNLTGGSMEMGRLISTSNALDVDGTDGEVRIETDAPLLWTTDVSRTWSDETESNCSTRLIDWLSKVDMIGVQTKRHPTPSPRASAVSRVASPPLALRWA